MSKPRIFTADWETYYDKDYSLSKIPMQQYVQDPRFEPIMLCVLTPDNLQYTFDPAFYDYDMQAMAAGIKSIGIEDGAVLCHNTYFDGLIFSKYGIKPKLWLDTRLMAKPIVGPYVKSVSLAQLSKYFDLAPKGTQVQNYLGFNRRAFSAEQFKDYESYCQHDVRLTWLIFNILKDSFPKSEIALIDRIIRMYTEPALEWDRKVLQEHYKAEVERKESLLAEMEQHGITKEMLMSNPQFAAVLEALGADIPLKISPTTGKPTYAFAKTDAGMRELMEHPNHVVSAVAQTRVGVKSTIEETRALRFLTLCELSPKVHIPLLYYGGHTGRLSGMDKLNFQNLKRGGRLRYALRAPEGHAIIPADQAQIEARIVATLSGQTDLIEEFACGVDVYASLATTIYGKEIHKATHPDERFVGKTGILGLGFGAGANKFQIMLDMYGHSHSIEFCQSVVNTYRRKYSMVPLAWKKCDELIHAMKANQRVRFGPVYSDEEKIILPNGMPLTYPRLRMDSEGNWVYGSGSNVKKLYGAKLFENIVQALARIVVMDQLVELSTRHKVVMSVHDENVFVVPLGKALAAYKDIVDTMSQSPEWMPDLPLDVEAHIGNSYGECK